MPRKWKLPKIRVQCVQRATCLRRVVLRRPLRIDSPFGELGAAVDPPTVVLASDGHNDAKLADLASTAAPLPVMDLRVSQGVVEAKVISKVDPIYPRDALSEKISGTVMIEATISERGTVDVLLTSSRGTVLADRRPRAVRQWRLVPASSIRNRSRCRKLLQ